MKRIEIPWNGDETDTNAKLNKLFRKYGVKVEKGQHENGHGEHVIVVSGDSQKLVKFLSGSYYGLPMDDIKEEWPQLFEGVQPTMKKSELKAAIRSIIRESDDEQSVSKSISSIFQIRNWRQLVPKDELPAMEKAFKKWQKDKK